MLEAYFYADIHAVNTVFPVALPPYQGDVESISHPKGDLKADLRALGKTYKETEHPGKILAQIDFDVVLGDPATCKSLRTLFAWVCCALGAYPVHKYHFHDDNYDTLSKQQLNDVVAAYGL